METLFDKLSSENQEKLLDDDLAKYYAESRLMKMHFVTDLKIDCASHIYYIITGKFNLNLAELFRLFEN